MEQTRKEALEKMGDIEQKFQSLKDDYFAQKTASLRNEIELVESGKHERYVAKQAQLKSKHDLSMSSAIRERAYQIRNAQLVYEVSFESSFYLHPSYA